VQAEHVAVPYKRLPSVEVAAVRLARHATAEPLKVALGDRTPFLPAVRGQADGQPAVEPAGAPLGAGELVDDGPPGHRVTSRR
jgi:hypothetical protein